MTIVVPASTTWLGAAPFGIPIMPEGFITTTGLFVSGFLTTTRLVLA